MNSQTKQDEVVHDFSEEVAEPAHRGLRSVSAVLAGLITAACIAWSLDAPSRLGMAFYTEQFLSLMLGMGLCALYLSISYRGKPHANAFPVLDIIFAAIALGIGVWVCINYERLLVDVSFYTTEVTVLSVALVLLLIEALRRCTGWALVIVVLTFVVYGLLANYAPLQLRGKASDFFPLLTYLAFDTNGIFGSPIKIGVEVVILFLFMGDMLIRAGGGEFFIDLAKSLLGHKRGGQAKICVMGSGLFGLISGSAVSSVAAVGKLTIPMMVRSGYSRKEAGAIEATGATGGQLMPPVMGAAAFLMAEFLEMPYKEIAIAAAIPAILYYLALFWQVDLIAAKRNLTTIAVEDMPKTGDVLKRGWHFLIPLGTLMFMLFVMGSSPESSAVITAAAIFATAMVRGYKKGRLTPMDLLRSLSTSGRTSLDLLMTLAAAGMVIGVLNLSGLGFALTLWLVSMAGNNMFILLLITGVVALVLGMGMPTSGVYILLAVLAGPALIQAGIGKLPAHMFILYFGMLSMITPPVALAAFAAANISKAGPMETAWMACRIGWAKFILPFMFVLSPTLLAQGSLFDIAFNTVTALIGVYLATAGMQGYFRRDLSPLYRVLLTAAGLAAILPDTQLSFVFPGFISVTGIAVGAAVLIAEYMATRGKVSAA